MKKGVVDQAEAAVGKAGEVTGKALDLASDVVVGSLRTVVDAPGRAFQTLFKKRGPAVGARPGTLVIAEGAPPPRIRVIAFDADGIEQHEIDDVTELEKVASDPRTTWIDIQGLGDEEVLRHVGEVFQLHPLALEDVVHVPQRPKTDEYAAHLLVVVRMVRLQERVLDLEQVGVFIGKGYVITFQERYGDVLDPVRRRLREAKGPIRQSGPDYLAYAILDTIMDAYYPVLEGLGELLQELEDEVMERATPDLLRRIQRVKRTLLLLRRALWPQREAMSQLAREPYALVSDSTRIYLRDTYDHCVQTAEVIESYRELVSELTNTYLSMTSNRMNEIMKVLTIMASIFIPLTFIAGIYGMNFENMPELHKAWAYPLVLAVMLLTALGMLVYFWRKGWIGQGPDE